MYKTSNQQNNDIERANRTGKHRKNKKTTTTTK